MTQKELLESVLLELTTIKKGMPNGELKLLVDDMKEMKTDISLLKKTLLNPEDGVIVKTNKNTEFREQEERRKAEYDKYITKLSELQTFKNGVTKALWIVFTMLAAIIIRMLMMHSEAVQ